MTIESYIAFALAAAALALVPGPTVTVIIANSLRFGARAGMLNVAGTQLTLGGVIGGTNFGLTKNGAGLAVLTGASTFTASWLMGRTSSAGSFAGPNNPKMMVDS